MQKKDGLIVGFISDLALRRQNKVTRMSVEMKGLINENRISLHGLSSLEDMYERDYLIQPYKIINGIKVIKGVIIKLDLLPLDSG